MILTPRTNKELYDIITSNSKLVLCFYVNWRIECQEFIKYLTRNDMHTICLVNMELLPKAQVVYNVVMKEAPYVVFMCDSKIIYSFYGNKQNVYEDNAANFF